MLSLNLPIEWLGVGGSAGEASHKIDRLLKRSRPALAGNLKVSSGDRAGVKLRFRCYSIAGR